MSLNTWAKGNLGGSLEIGARGSEIPSGGGGDTPSGDSDFTTAELTIVNNQNQPANVLVCCAYTEDMAGIDASFGAVSINSGTTVKIDVILYKGKAVFDADGNDITGATGDIEPDDDFGAVITGDATITLGSDDGPMT